LGVTDNEHLLLISKAVSFTESAEEAVKRGTFGDLEESCVEGVGAGGSLHGKLWFCLRKAMAFSAQISHHHLSMEKERKERKEENGRGGKGKENKEEEGRGGEGEGNGGREGRRRKGKEGQREGGKGKEGKGMKEGRKKGRRERRKRKERGNNDGGGFHFKGLCTRNICRRLSFPPHGPFSSEKGLEGLTGKRHGNETIRTPSLRAEEGLSS
jgi:hypothetical protein